MGGNTNSITECLNQMVALTKKNLAILKAVNDAFYTKKNHLAVIVDDEKFVIPSFISLESRIELLENNLQHIVDAPLTGEAFTYHDGTTQRIELSGYSTTPNHLELSKVVNFGTEVNNIFKDFMTPNPFVKVDISSIPNNIKHVNVRKICVKNDDLISALKSIAPEGIVDFAAVDKILYGYDENIDYLCYDTVKRLPIRSGVAQGDYEIINIIDNYQDNNFDEFYELELDHDLVYYIKNGTIQKDIRIGDTLVTYNDKVMLEVVDLNQLKRTITVKVMYGAYADLQDKTSNNPDLYKVKYYKSNEDLSASKYINVPLEEDRYVVIFITPINDTTNTQAPWGVGIFIDSDDLWMQDPDNPEDKITFRDYYNRYVNNVGDALASITAMMDDDQQISRLNQLEFNTIKELKPTINKELIKVTQINKHLNDSKAVKSIRNLYNQKSQYKTELEVTQRNIDKINKDLSELSFDDSTNSRTVYETQLAEYNAKKVDLVNSIDSVMQEISVNANSADVPIENAKYRIRGFIDVNIQTLNSLIPSYVDVIKIDVEYRYKNKSSFTGNAETYPAGGDGNYIYSDWNKMDSFYRKRVAEYINGNYKYKWEDLNMDTNNPSFNQIDIPISQGELVDIRVRYIYNLGYPFAEIASSWSPIYTQDFPKEFTQNVEILDIIAENNNEIQSKHFERIIEQQGIKEHMEDQVQDQTDVYHHHADHIASGFLTEERRVIPVSDKLLDFNAAIEDLKAEVFGASSSNLIITLNDMSNTIQLKPNIINAFHTSSYVNAIANESAFRISGATPSDDDPLMAVSQMTINIYNNGSYQMKLHSLFPGAYDQDIVASTPAPFNPGEFCGTNNVAMLLDNADNNSLFMNQRYNQFMYFRTKLVDTTNPNNGLLYKQVSSVVDAITGNDVIMPDGIPQNQLIGNGKNIIELISDSDMVSLYDAMMAPLTGADTPRMGFLYPYPGAVGNICIPSDQTYITIDPGESVSIPLNFIYWFKKDDSNPLYKKTQLMRNLTVTRAIAFDIRTSLYQDPITFKIVVDASYDDSVGYKLKRADKVTSGLTLQRSTVARVNITPQQIVKANTSNSTRTTKKLNSIKK